MAGLYCRRTPLGDTRQLRIAGAICLPANLLAFLVIPAVARLVSAHGLGSEWTGIAPQSTLPLSGLSPALTSALKSPKVEIVIDDGRRYLGRTEQRFDVIIQNTIVSWRAYAASLFSREYQELSRRHLSPGGVLYYNATYSAAAQRTGVLTFPFALRYQNMILASDSPIPINRERFEQKLDRWEIDGLRVLPAGVTAAGLDLLRERPWRGVAPWENRASILGRTAGEPVITEDNMANEWQDLTLFP